MKLRWHPRVADDIFSAAAYLLGESDEAARRFSAAVERTLKELTAMPGMGSRKEYLSPRLHDVRTWRVKRFRRYLVYYLPLADGIRVLAVLHGARDAEAILTGRV